jgi:crotonobetainyl-CoA:carnitine CoA-transferase CaiB-like acyl-CoA transferase
MAYAPTVQAETGFTLNTAAQFGGNGTTGEGRLRTDPLSHADVYTGMQGVIAILAALARRERTGEGQHIDVAMAAVMMYINEKVHADLSGEDLGAERPILGAADTPFFLSPEGNVFISPFSLVGSLTFPFYCAAMRRPELMDDPRFRTPEARAANLAVLHGIIQTWIRTFADMASLDAHLDEAKIATGQVRSIQEFAAGEWVQQWPATKQVPDRSGGWLTIPGAPWHFSADKADDAQGFDGARHNPARQGEHNTQVLLEVDFTAEQISNLEATGALVQPSRGMSF